MLRWIIALAVACGLVYLAATVSFGGKTLMDRALEVLDLSDCDDIEPGVEKPVDKKPLTVEQKDTDQLTDQDRAKLDELINIKLKEKDVVEASGAKR